MPLYRYNGIMADAASEILTEPGYATPVSAAQAASRPVAARSPEFGFAGSGSGTKSELLFLGKMVYKVSMSMALGFARS